MTVSKTKLTALNLFAAILFFACPAFAAIGTPVRIGTANSTTASTTLAVTVPAGGVATGNTILVTFAMDPTAGNATVADTGGNTYTLDRAITNGSVTTGVKTYVFSAPVTTALTAGNTITVTFPSTAAKAVSAAYVSGLVTSSSAVDKSAANTGNSAAPSSGATAATAQADELLLGALGAESRISFDTLTPANAFTTLTNASADTGTSGTSITIYSTYRIVSTNGAFTASGTLSGGNNRNWAAAIVTYKALVLTAQTITFTSPGNQTYGVAPLTLGATASSGLTVSYAVSGVATISGDTLTITNAGTVTIVASQAGNGTYAAATSVTNTITVAPVTLTVSGVTANNKNYNGNTTATIDTNSATLNGVLGGETVTLGGTPTGTFADKNIGTNKTVTVTGITLTGAQASHYSLTQPAAVADILAATLTVTATGVNRGYDGTTDATVTFADNRASGDVLTVTGSAAFDTAAVGNGKTVTVTSLALTGAGAGNYVLTNTTIATTANITAKNLIVTGITASNKIYDRTNTATIDTSAAVLGAGVVGSEVVVLDVSAAVGTFASSNVANGLTVTVNGLLLTGADAGNYSATATTTANITKLPLTIVSGLTANNKNYNGNTNATVATNGVTFDAVIAPDAVTLRTNGYTAAFADKHTGAAKPVTIAGLTLSGSSSNNYSVIMPTNLVADILATNIAVTARVNTKFYDTTVTATNTPTITVGSLQTGDTNAFTETYATAAAGLTNKVLVPAGVVNDGNGGSNYNVTFANFNTGTITPKVLVATGITATNKVYDRTNSAVIDSTAAVLTGVLPPDDVLLNTNSGVGTFASSNAANNIVVTISGLTLTGVDAANYSVTASNTTANITKLAISVASGFTANNKAYNGTLAATIRSNAVTLAGVIAGDTITARTNGYLATFADKHAATAKIVTVTNLTLGGTTATNNYTLSQPTLLTADITPTNLTVTAVTNTKIYDQTNTAAAIPTLSASGLQTGDTNGFTESYATAAAGITNKVLIPAGAILDGNGGSNYNVTLVNFNTGTITPRALTVTGVTAENKIYDRTNTALVDVSAALLNTANILPPDDVQLDTNNAVGIFATANAGTNLTVNVVSMTLTGVDATNYSIAATAIASITKKDVSLASGLTANNKTYNGTLAATISSNTVTLAGVIAGDTVTARTNGYTAVFADKLVGTNKPVTVTGIQLGGSTATNNYTLLSPTNFAANITAATLTITAIGVNKVYDGTTDASVTLTNNKASGDTITQTYTTAAFADKNTGTNKTISVSGIDVSGADLGNYTLASTNAAATANITRATVVLTGARTYDGTSVADVSNLVISNNFDGANLTLIGAGTLASKNTGVQAVSVGAVPTRIQTRTGTGNNAANFTVTLGSTPVAGHTLVAVVSIHTNSTSQGVASIVQTGATWTRAAQSTTTGALTEIWYATNLASASTTVTVNYVSGATRGEGVVMEYSGLLTASPVDKTVSASGTSTNVASGSTATTSQANELWIAGVSFTNSSYTFTPTTGGFTTVTNLDGASGTAANNTSVTALEKIPAAIGTAAIGGTLNTNSQWSAVIVAFKAASAGLPLTLAGSEATNYTLPATPGSMTVAAKPLAVSGLTASSKIYDGSTTAPLGGTATLLAAEAPGTGSTNDGAPYTGDTIMLGGVALGNFADANVGVAKSVTVTGSTVNNTNYTVVQQTGLTADITPQTPVVATAPTASNLTLGQTLGDSILTGGSVTNAAGNSVVGTFAFTTPATAPGVGTTSESVTFTPADTTNYNAALGTASVTVINNGGDQTITFAALADKTYGDATFGVSATASSGLPVSFSVVSGSATLTLGTNVTVTGAGSVTLRASQPGNGLYNAATNVDRAFTVAAKSLTPSVAVDNKVYDGLATASLTNRSLTGVINSDDVTLTNSAANFADKNIGTNKTVLTTGLTLNGAAATNYTLAITTLTNTADITVRALTVTVTGGDKLYDGDTNAPVTYPDNRVTNDVFTVTGSASFADKNVGAAKPVTVIGIAISGTDAGNYALTTNAAALTATISPRPLTVTADSVTRAFDEPNPGTFTVSYSGFISGEAEELLSGFVIVSTTATNGSAAGAYPIEVDASFLTSDNYSFAPSNGVLTINPVSLTGSVTSSLNPARPGSNVTFTATLVPVAPGSTTPSGTVQFYVDGSAFSTPRPLTSGTATLITAALAHGAHTISAAFAGNGNYSATSNTLASAQVINRAPAAANDALATRVNIAVSTTSANLLLNDSDADTDPLTVTAVSAASVHGGTASLSGVTVTYAPPTNYSGADSFTYTLNDGFTNVTGTVNVTVYSATNSPERVVSNTVLPDGNQHLEFTGIPGFSYVVQATTNLAPAVWVNLSTNLAPANGQFHYDDLTATNHPMRYYRTEAQ